MICIIIIKYSKIRYCSVLLCKLYGLLLLFLFKIIENSFRKMDLNKSIYLNKNVHY